MVVKELTKLKRQMMSALRQRMQRLMEHMVDELHNNYSRIIRDWYNNYDPKFYKRQRFTFAASTAYKPSRRPKLVKVTQRGDVVTGQAQISVGYEGVQEQIDEHGGAERLYSWFVARPGENRKKPGKTRWDYYKPYRQGAQFVFENVWMWGIHGKESNNEFCKGIMAPPQEIMDDWYQDFIKPENLRKHVTKYIDIK